jgi:tRNA 2-selenouridine synthase
MKTRNMSDYIIPYQNFEDLLISGVPFLDVRAEIEFAKGSFPTSANIPILRDHERQVVGTCYKNNGREAAIELGHSLIKGLTKNQRIEAWCEFSRTNANTHIYCWRGGMRSNYAREWILASGIDIPLIDGGFKALRHVILDQITDAADQVPIVRIGGKTGTAKTVLVNAVEFSTDLEGHANHRGSSFGQRVSGVPTQINFENSLGIDLLRKRRTFPKRTLVVEDEGRRIGSNSIPKDFYDKMRSADVAVVEMPMEFRVQRIAEEYVTQMTKEFLDAHPVDGWEMFVDYLTQSLVRVRKRLGLENYKLIASLMKNALRRQHKYGDTSSHETWIFAMLRDYYDPMYAYQLGEQSNKIVFQGGYEEVLEWAIERSRSSDTIYR